MAKGQRESECCSSLYRCTVGCPWGWGLSVRPLFELDERADCDEAPSKSPAAGPPRHVDHCRRPSRGPSDSVSAAARAGAPATRRARRPRHTISMSSHGVDISTATCSQAARDDTEATSESVCCQGLHGETLPHQLPSGVQGCVEDVGFENNRLLRLNN